jgi:uncharacterized integral membrane protein
MRNRRTLLTGLFVAVILAFLAAAANVAVNYATGGVAWWWWLVLLTVAVAGGLAAAIVEHSRMSSQERKVAEQLINFLRTRRVLWYPMIREIPHEAVESVIKMRERVASDRATLRHPQARQALETIEFECTRLLDLPREWFQSLFFPKEGEDALTAFRARVHPAVATLASAYQIAPPPWLEFHGGFEDEGEIIYVPEPPPEWFSTGAPVKLDEEPPEPPGC